MATRIIWATSVRSVADAKVAVEQARRMADNGFAHESHVWNLNSGSTELTEWLHGEVPDPDPVIVQTAEYRYATLKGVRLLQGDKVKLSFDKDNAHVLLHDLQGGRIFGELVFGAWNNSCSILRRVPQGQHIGADQVGVIPGWNELELEAVYPDDAGQNGIVTFKTTLNGENLPSLVDAIPASGVPNVSVSSWNGSVCNFRFTPRTNLHRQRLIGTKSATADHVNEYCRPDKQLVVVFHSDDVVFTDPDTMSTVIATLTSQPRILEDYVFASPVVLNDPGCAAALKSISADIEDFAPDDPSDASAYHESFISNKARWIDECTSSNQVVPTKKGDALPSKLIMVRGDKVARALSLLNAKTPAEEDGVCGVCFGTVAVAYGDVSGEQRDKIRSRYTNLKNI